jgi:hypothetical protein
LAKEITFGDNADGKQVNFPFSGLMPITVRDDREGWIRIHDGKREGWADKSQFVLVRDALAYFHRRIQANPKDTLALYMRGVGWVQKGEPDNAIKDFDECIRLEPTKASAFNSRGCAWYDKRDYDRAFKDYDEAIRLEHATDQCSGTEIPHAPKNPRQSDGVIRFNASPIAYPNASSDRAARIRRYVFVFDHAISIGFMSGEYGGNNTIVAPRASSASRTRTVLCAERLSMNTTSPERKCGPNTCSMKAANDSESVAPS